MVLKILNYVNQTHLCQYQFSYANDICVLQTSLNNIKQGYIDLKPKLAAKNQNVTPRIHVQRLQLKALNYTHFCYPDFYMWPYHMI